MNQKPSQLRLVLIWSHVVASRICGLAIRGWSAMSAMGGFPELTVVGADGDRPPSAPVLSTIDALQLPFGFCHSGLGILGAGAEVGKHIDHDEVGNRGRRLFTDLADA